MKKKAFTLAEVLITLGVIGVVAAMTLPTLMHSYRKHVIETQIKEFYSIFNQAIKLSEVDNEEIEGWDWPVRSATSGGITKYEWFVKYLQPYMKTSTIKKTYHLYCVWMDGFAIDFINGTGVTCGFEDVHNSSNFLCLFFPDARKLDNLKDASPETKKMIPGKDYFVFQIDRNNPARRGLQPYSGRCFQTTGMQHLPSPGCADLIKENGWKIPGDYPIKL